MDIHGLHSPPVHGHFSASRGWAGLENRPGSLGQTATYEKDPTRGAGEFFQESPSILHVPPPH
jgi:hypothetical protein